MLDGDRTVREGRRWSVGFSDSAETTAVLASSKGQHVGHLGCRGAIDAADAPGHPRALGAVQAMRAKELALALRAGARAAALSCCNQRSRAACAPPPPGRKVACVTQ